jgi:hypothetical protein
MLVDKILLKVSAWVTCEPWMRRYHSNRSSRCKVQEFEVVEIKICDAAVFMNLMDTNIKIENELNN